MKRLIFGVVWLQQIWWWCKINQFGCRPRLLTVNVSQILKTEWAKTMKYYNASSKESGTNGVILVKYTKSRCRYFYVVFNIKIIKVRLGNMIQKKLDSE
jgi:hypothetical protein